MRRAPWLGSAGWAVTVMVVCVIAGAVFFFWPFLGREKSPLAGVPTPPAMYEAATFGLSPGQSACMDSVTFDPRGRLVEFSLPQPSDRASGVRLSLKLTLTAPGYHTTTSVRGAHHYGELVLPVVPPRRSVIGTACFINRGHNTVILSGTTEARTISRSTMTVDGQPVPGDIALTFLEARPGALADRLNEIFAHASNLTDSLMPVWLIWALAALIALGVPAGVVLAFYLALRRDEQLV